MRRLCAILLVSVLAAVVSTASAGAARQGGLVNINVEDNAIQVPVSVAANICDVNVVLLASQVADTGSADCTALSTATSDATVTPGSGGTRQNGLINVNLENTVIQIPVAAAANVCDVNVVALATAILLNDATGCTANGGADGIVFPPA